MTQTLADMRRDYTRDGLSETQAPLETLLPCFVSGSMMRSRPSNCRSSPMP
jgi:hypothetical protein